MQTSPIPQHAGPSCLPPAAGQAQQQADCLDVRREHYVAALRRMDWDFEWSDDHRAWTRGRDALTRLRAEQVELDPTGALWQQHAPRGFPPIVSGPAA